MLTAAEEAHHIGAVILEIPKSPDPLTSEYADCVGIAKIEILGALVRGGLPREILVALPFFKERTLTEAASYQVGDHLEITLLDRDHVEEELRSMQRVDESDDHHLELFFAVDSHRWEAGSFTKFLTANAQPISLIPHHDGAPADFSDRRTGATKRARQEAIATDIARIHRLLASHQNSWDHWVDEVEPWRRKLKNTARESGGGILKDGLFFKIFNNLRYQQVIDAGEAAPAPKMIRALHAELDSRGIDLIVVPFPFKEEVHSDVFLSGAPADNIFVPERLRLILDLLEAGIEVLDLTLPLHDAPDRSSLFYPYEDTPPADGAIQVAASAITKRLKRYDIPAEISGLKTRVTTFTMPEKILKRRNSRYRFLPEDTTFPATLVTTGTGDLLPVRNASSPFLLIGDSFTRCPDFYKCRGANLKDHLTLRTHILPGTLSINGSAAQTMRNIAREGERFLTNRQVVIFVFSTARIFTERYPEGHPDRLWEIVPLKTNL